MADKKKLKNTNLPWMNINLLFIVAATLISYYPSLKNDFVNWDDIIYVMNNDMIRSFSWENLKKIFSAYYMGNYHPLILLSFSFDYSLFQLTPQGYHVHNLILHLVNTLLVYFFCFQLFDKRTGASLIVSLLFAIHPMHVESVAWISERKDLLYTLFFIAGLITYLYYVKKNEKRFLIFTLLFCLLSNLSKAQAVTFPLVLFLIDYFLSRKFNLRVILEKIPFFILSLFFGILAIYAQKADNSINAPGIAAPNSLFFGLYSIWIYLFKFFIPVNLICIYEYPLTIDGRVPSYIYFSPLIIIILAFIIYKTWRNYRFVTFGILFFLFTIFPVLQFLPVGMAVAAERYTYIPYIGLFAIAGVFYIDYLPRFVPLKRRKILNFIGYGVILLFMILTWIRTTVWKDSITLWTDVMEKNPRSISAYINRGYMYNHTDQYEKAILDCNNGIKVDSNNFKLYINRAISYRALGKYELSLADLNKVLEKNPQSYETYLDRGTLYTDNFQKYDLGIADFKELLKHSPGHANGYYNLGVAYFKKGVYDSAFTACRKAIELDEKVSRPYYLMALLYSLKNDYQKAYQYGIKARELGFAVEESLLKSWEPGSNISVPVIKK